MLGPDHIINTITQQSEHGIWFYKGASLISNRGYKGESLISNRGFNLETLQDIAPSPRL